MRAFSGAEGLPEPDGSPRAHEAWSEWVRSNEREAWPEWLSWSQVTIVPFYDRTDLIRETVATLGDALLAQILITIIVVVVMLAHLRSSLAVSATLPLAVLISFIFMKTFGVDANIVALSGIAIAIGTMVDMGIILNENILARVREADPAERRLDVVHRATREVAGAVLAAVATTVIGFLPVFTMTGAEGRLFKPLAFTKTFALIGAAVVALTVLPAIAHLLMRSERGSVPKRSGGAGRALTRSLNLVVVVVVGVVLARHWSPLGPGAGELRNLVFVGLLVAGLLLTFLLFLRFYTRLLAWCLDHKLLFLSAPAVTVLLGASVWLGFDRVFGFVPASLGGIGVDQEAVRSTRLWAGASDSLPGLGREFMPALDEGSFLYMPTTMPHASIGEAAEVLRLQDMAISSIPEVRSVVGKIGRVDSALDPAPVSMIETVITYHDEYGENERGERVRLWRDHIRSPDDIWDEIVAAAQVPGTTSAPRLQPIEARLVMLQSGMRAPMGIKVQGPDLETIETVGLELERLIKEVPGVEPATVFADRIVGKPYLEIDLDREALARFGLHIGDVQEVIEVAVGGKRLTTTVEGRERYPVRVRYQRELRDTIEDLGRILMSSRTGAQIPLSQLAEIRYVRGPQVIKSEDTFLVGYVIFDKQPGFAEVEVVEAVREHIAASEAAGDLRRPPGVKLTPVGTYENQVRAQRTLSFVLPLALALILLVLYLHFRSVTTTALVGSGVLVAWAGGFVMVWLWGQDWFLDVGLFGHSLRDVFQVSPINLSVAVWVGFLALFGIATDDGVVMATYLQQSFSGERPASLAEVRQRVVDAGKRRARPCVMTTATTMLALMPVLTSSGRGADVMIPMAIPSFGGMALAMLTMFVVPVLYGWIEEVRFRRRSSAETR